MLALAIGGVAAALVVSKSNNNSTTVTQVAGPAPATSSASTPSTTTTDTATQPTTSTATQPTTTTSNAPTAPPVVTPPAIRPSGASPQAAFRHYWQLVNTGQYQQAFDMETSDEQGAETTFVSDKSITQPQVVIVSVGTPNYPSSSEADVPVDWWSQDQHGGTSSSDTTCREFTGTAVMIKAGGKWLYGHPNYQAQAYPNITYPNCHP